MTKIIDEAKRKEMLRKKKYYREHPEEAMDHYDKSHKEDYVPKAIKDKK